MTDLVPIAADRANLPAPKLMQQRMAAGQGLANNFSDGVLDSFPRISIKGKVFSARAEGRNEVLKDQQTGHPLPFLDVVFVNASRSLAKTYYTKGFAEGDMNPPDCWSLDSVRPDPSILKPVNPTCQNCPMNAFGSRITADGKAAKACSDSRRVALTMPHMLTAMQEPMTFLLRIPQSSLKNLKAYAEGQLARNGYEPGGCVTRISFDYQAAFPKLQFQFVGPLYDAEFVKVVGLANSPTVASMLDAPDFDAAATPGQMADTQQVQPLQRQAPPTGFGAGDLTHETGGTSPFHDASMQPLHLHATQPQPQTVHVIQPVTQPVSSVQQMQPELIRLPTGELLDPMTGEIVPEHEPEPEIDPEVIKIADGRFFHRGKGAFVASQFKGAGPATAVPAQAKMEAPKRAPRKPKAEAAPANGHTPAPTPEAVEQQVQQGMADASAEYQRQQEMAQPNPGVTQEKQVVAASPRLEALLAQMQPNKAN